LLSAKGEFIAIFDADFVPQKTGSIKPFLILRIQNWGCSNPLGTSKPQLFGNKKIQAFALDAHFILEQVGRNSKLHFINFNGTAMWRKQCILDAGNWESDTLEDLDLSYRAQLKTGNSNILKMVTPAELPAIISATRSQQFRWNKGGAENFSKMPLAYSNQSLLIENKSAWHVSFIE
jgi:cellulose synthase/poly-beta-1,6-N-acetylglucosamine synthase-like glycosyltransferase